jgi:thiamine-phosphate pyrophosphorylase
MNKNKEEQYAPLRIIDANLNRLREGIRVIEDICRFFFNSESFSKRLKHLRHESRIDNYKSLISSRDILNDPSKQTTQSEQNRADVETILISNFKRAQESSRVLEEVLKLTNPAEAEKFKQIRYELYNLEKEILL